MINFREFLNENEGNVDADQARRKADQARRKEAYDLVTPRDNTFKLNHPDVQAFFKKHKDHFEEWREEYSNNFYGSNGGRATDFSELSDSSFFQRQYLTTLSVDHQLDRLPKN
jgi:hypothetical protein